MTCDDFRGIAISPLISKAFKCCILDRLEDFLFSYDVQFGFKNCSECRNAIHTVRKTVDRLVKDGSTVNMCAIDLTKAFDK